MNSSLRSCALLIGLITLLTCLPESLSTTTPTSEENVPQTCNMCCHGPPGKPGMPGNEGLKGDKGSQGFPGKHGPSGGIGPQGPKGNTGLKGEKGQHGEPGHKGLKGNKGSEGYPGVRGSQGPTGRQGTRGYAGLKGEKGESGLQATKVRKSAFTAVRNTSVFFTESTILFTSTEINVGEDFDNNTGKFTCRISGLYYFTFNFLSGYDFKFIVHLVLNGRGIAYAVRSPSDGFLRLGSEATVQLDVGDEVWLMNQRSLLIFADSDTPLTFTGFMIYDMN